MKINPHNSRNGYSLIEVLIASILLSIAIVSVFQAVSNGSRISRKDFLMRRAYQHCEQILENPQNSYKGSYYEDAIRNGSGNLAEDQPVSLDSVLLDDCDNIDPTDDLFGQALFIVSDISTGASIENIPRGASGCCDNVDAKKLTARVKWYEQGTWDSVSLETIVSAVNIN